MKSYVRFESPKELTDKVLEAVELARETGAVAKGTNEVTKSIERSSAKLVVIAEDVEPEEIVMHLAPLCDEKGIPLCYAPTKSELGRAAGIDVPCATVAIVKEGEGKRLVDEVVDRIGKLAAAGKGKPAKEERPEKPEEKPEEKPAEEKPREKPAEKKKPKEKPEPKAKESKKAKK